MKRNGCGKPYPNCPPTSWLRKNALYRKHRRGRRPRRPFRWMTDDVGLLLNVTSRVVGRTVPGAPPSVDRWRRFRAPPHLRARPCVACLPRLTGCGRSAWPILPASLTALPPSSAATRIRSRASQPAHHWYGRTHVILSPTPGGRGSPPLRKVLARRRRTTLFRRTHLAPTPQSRPFGP